jgi:hypothetical protein
MEESKRCAGEATPDAADFQIAGRDAAILSTPDAKNKAIDSLSASQKLPHEPGFVTCENCGAAVILHITGRPRVHAFCNRPECIKAASSARARASRAGKRLRPIDGPLPRDVRTIHGNNSALIAAVAHLYLPDEAIIADVTRGMGVFWRRFIPRHRLLIGSDLREVAGVKLRADFRQLPYADACIDVVVIDPPYTHCGHYLNNHRYGSALTDNMRHREIVGLYRAGMTEALRVLKPGGTLWVKCQDENDGQQYWTHCEIKNVAGDLGMRSEDLFVLAPRPAPTRRWQRQKHARKAHSYLWIFRKLRKSSDARRRAQAVQ